MMINYSKYKEFLVINFKVLALKKFQLLLLITKIIFDLFHFILLEFSQLQLCILSYIEKVHLKILN